MEQSEDVTRIPRHNHSQVPWTKRDMLMATAIGSILVLGLAVAIGFALRFYHELTGAEWVLRLLGIDVLVGELALLLPVWLFGVRKYGLPWGTVGFRPFDVRRAAGLGCLFLLVSFAFNFIWAMLMLVLTGLDVQPDVLPYFGGGAGDLPLALLTVSLAAPVAEEAFFRGYLFAGLREHTSLRGAILVSAALFALVHVLPISMPPLFVLGVLFALLYHQTGSIWPAVILHSSMNTLAVLASYLLQTLEI
ncbi:MAG TPA: type II CAAX endopeptidase family protein [Anaerolineae bacterium]|nr:type II CAAX endopeptidase family protein [Anaerolineae bacterium]